MQRKGGWTSERGYRERHTDRQTERHTDRQKDRKRCTNQPEVIPIQGRTPPRTCAAKRWRLSEWRQTRSQLRRLELKMKKNIRSVSQKQMLCKELFNKMVFFKKKYLLYFYSKFIVYKVENKTKNKTSVWIITVLKLCITDVWLPLDGINRLS